MTPSASTTDLRPAVSFVDAGPSGPGTFEATLDGKPCRSRTPGDVHTAAIWRTARTRSPTTPPMEPATPRRLVGVRCRRHDSAVALTRDAGRRVKRRGPWPEVAFDVADAGIGVDPGSLRMVIDGVDVVAARSCRRSLLARPGRDLAYGSHVKVTIADRSGNAMTPAEWTFHVADVRTRPVRPCAPAARRSDPPGRRRSTRPCT
jgi:hypothetical protein